MDEKIKEIIQIIEKVRKEKSRELSLAGMGLAELPPELQELDFLTDLDLSNNKLEKIPGWIKNLKNLTLLNLSKNNIQNIPSEICELLTLQSLSLSHNQISDIPPEIRHLRNLQFLDLKNTQIKEISSQICNLTNLRSLDISSTSIEKLPSELVKLVNLESLEVKNASLSSPPIEVVNQGIQAIRRYFQELEEQGTEALQEVKLIIVGEGAAGKTTLARLLQNPSSDLPKESETTRGIDINKWVFQTLSGQDLTVNIWDFGGQEIYHATHQFFLTKRSLYVLVVDTRREYDLSLQYWLQVIELFGDGSPVLIIQNEKGDRSRAFDLPFIKSKFPFVKEVYQSNFLTRRGFENVVDAIKFHIQKLPHIGEQLPKVWMNIRNKIEQLSFEKNYIDEREYLAVCRENKIIDDKRAFLLSDYFHDLGVFMHFKDNPILKRTIVLNPSWSTEAVYKILDNNEVRTNYGRFSKSDLEKAWNEEKYLGKEYELLALMMKFELCYELDAPKDKYIFPQLLPLDKPDYTWQREDNLYFKIRYDFMPKGIMSRFIVRMARYIESNLVWRTGVILSRENTKGEIIEDNFKREIKIRLSGKNKKDFFTIIREQLQIINESFPKIKIEELVPCNCATCIKSEEPYYFSYADLRKRQALNKLTIECHNSFDAVDVSSLLMGVEFSKNVLSGSSVSAGRDIHIGDIILPESTQEFDTFISYNHQDKIEVREIAEALRDEGLNIWLDVWEMQPGKELKFALKEAVENSKSILVCIGEKSLSKLQLLEINKAKEKDKKIIPVLLIQNVEKAKIPSSIDNLSYVNFADKSSDPINKIIYGISGQFSSGLKSQFRINELKGLIAKNKIAKVFEELEEFIPRQEKFHNELILLSSRYNRLQQNKLKQAISYSDETIESLKIQEAIIKLLDKLDRSNVSNELERLQKEVEENPDDIQSWKDLATVYEQLGDKEKAEESQKVVDVLKEHLDFERNKKNPVILERISASKINFFDDFVWELQPNMNILLGKNGYGKSQLLRLIIGMLYRDQEKTKEFFKSRKIKSYIEITAIQSEVLKKIRRTSLVFDKSFGKIPVLSIPDLRFVNKSKTTIDLFEDEKNDIVKYGSYHFLYQQPFESTVQNFLYGLCNDYMENNKQFESEIFSLITEVFRQLTGDDFIFHSIRRKNNVDFEMQVITEGNGDNPLPIQKASQGTLSILSIIGLIHRFLKELNPELSINEISKQRAVIIIDEIDAHLHPSWQQKIVLILRKTFPNVQFICTAHSPLVVAGCREQEVSVLRKSEEGFYVEQFDEDFIGYKSEELYSRIFEIEGKDDSYKYFSAMIPLENDLRKELETLEKKKENLSANERLRLNELYDTLHYIERTKNKTQERNKLSHLERENRKLKSELRKLKSKAELKK